MKKNELQGFILAAGLGTRMGPLSRVLPKPAWTLCGKPLLLWGADDMKREGLLHVACNAHHLPEKLIHTVENRIEVCLEPELLGSAGGLSHAVGRSADPLAVWNGDALAQIPWQRFLAAHRELKAQLSWLLMPMPMEKGHAAYNPVWMDRDQRIAHVGPQPPTGLSGPYHFTGASLWGADALALIPKGPSDTKKHILPHLQRHLGVVIERLSWHDIGSPDHLIQAAQVLAPHHEGRIAGSYIHPEARIEGNVRLKRCVLGPGTSFSKDFEDENALWYMEAQKQLSVRLD